MEQFEQQLNNDLHQYLLSLDEVDDRQPECPDVEEKWETIAKAYLPDGIREFQDFPSASLGWMMYIGMAVAKMWDTEGMEQREQSDACIDSAESRQNSTEGQWEIYGNIEDLYA